MSLFVVSVRISSFLSGDSTILKVMVFLTIDEERNISYV